MKRRTLIESVVVLAAVLVLLAAGSFLFSIKDCGPCQGQGIVVRWNVYACPACHGDARQTFWEWALPDRRLDMTSSWKDLSGDRKLYW